MSSDLIIRGLAAIGVITVAGAFAYRWSDTPIQSSACGQTNNCATCHQGSAPRTHTAEFIATGHGLAAYENRQQCLGCHQQQDSCDKCHLATQPSWHTEAFRHPSLGWRQRDEHALIATGRRATCSECHSQRFQDQCASCHRPDEEDLLLEFPD